MSTPAPLEMNAVGGVPVRGRFVGRIVEIERDKKGRLVREAWTPGFALNVFLAMLAFWRKMPLLDAARSAVQCYGPPYKIARIVEENIPIQNGATTQGLNHALDVTFRAQSQTAAWYVGIINNSGYTTGVSVNDTAASHGGWTEWDGYDESVRQTWSPAAASAGSVANASAMTFTNNTGSSVTVRGVGVWSVSTKGATTGILWATAVESAGRTLSNTQAFQVIYQVDFTPTS